MKYNQKFNTSKNNNLKSYFLGLDPEYSLMNENPLLGNVFIFFNKLKILNQEGCMGIG